jgi:hypothetical protein
MATRRPSTVTAAGAQVDLTRHQACGRYGLTGAPTDQDVGRHWVHWRHDFTQGRTPLPSSGAAAPYAETVSTHEPDEARVIPLHPQTSPPGSAAANRGPQRPAGTAAARPPRAPLWRDLVGGALRRERLAQERTLKDVAEAARISMPYLSELERGRKEASSEVLAAAAGALGLGLADLLSLTQDELSRHARSRMGRGRTAPYDGLCLAA